MPTPLHCEDCNKEILTPEDEMSYFDHDRCSKCEAQMFQYMQDVNEKYELELKNKF